jgi:hypothetical protein
MGVGGTGSSWVSVSGAAIGDIASQGAGAVRRPDFATPPGNLKRNLNKFAWFGDPRDQA